MDFDTRYQKLNIAQREAVDTVDGPVMVIAGPGTGKTELLSMRVANILRRTDTLPGNILCLTFTESGAAAMRSRLAEIIGRDAYAVTISTFHSFGSEIIARNREYFYRGAQFTAADDIAQLEILTSIFDTLDHTNVLTSKMNGDYTQLKDTLRTISELKRSGLTSDELLRILDVSDAVCDFIESDIRSVFGPTISKKTTESIPSLAKKLAEYTVDALPLGLTPLNTVMAQSLARAYDEATEADSTKPITAWKKLWTEKDTRGDLVLKDRKRHDKLRAISYVYYQYLTNMQAASLYDYDDMILEVIHAVETQNDLRLNLQESYQYVMIDEFQDTNLAQLRLLLNLVNNPVNEGLPNLMIVGDDDQAIYSFQGADVNNIRVLRQRYPAFQTVVLTDNYRSASIILSAAHDVIEQGTERLEAVIPNLNKTLAPHVSDAKSEVNLTSFATPADEHERIAESIASHVKTGQTPSSIAVLARRHTELESLVPYLIRSGLDVSYEHSDNILDIDVIRQLELIVRIVLYISHKRLDDAEALLPELLSHPAWNIDSQIIWKLSLDAYREKRLWLDYMSTLPELAPLHTWLIACAIDVPHEPLERMIDRLVGTPSHADDDFRSPLYEYFFSDSKRDTDPETYLTYLDALRKLRSGLRDYAAKDQPTLDTFIEYIDLHHRYERTITLSHDATTVRESAVQLMSVHKSKGLEFDTVYILGLSDNQWGSHSRTGKRGSNYPENLPLAPTTGSLDEQIRLLYVGMTRAKRVLNLSYCTTDEKNKEHLLTDLLIDSALTPRAVPADESLAALTAVAEFDWQSAVINMPQRSMRDMLASRLESYRLSATHINSFIDITHGGPQGFLLQSLLHFPGATSPAADFGSAIHAALQSCQDHLLATGDEQPLEDTLHNFEVELEKGSLSETEREFYTGKGYDALRVFLASAYTGFSHNAKSEQNSGAVKFGVATLTGKFDLLTTDKGGKSLSVIDYKTGKPSSGWKGGADYDKVKLHKYKQQLMFYRLIIENSPQYREYHYEGGALQYVEPNKSGDIEPPLMAEFTDEEYMKFQQLVAAVWHCITTLELPDTSKYDQNYSGVLAFEQMLIDKYSK